MTSPDNRAIMKKSGRRDSVILILAMFLMLMMIARSLINQSHIIDQLGDNQKILKTNQETLLQDNEDKANDIKELSLRIKCLQELHIQGSSDIANCDPVNFNSPSGQISTSTKPTPKSPQEAPKNKKDNTKSGGGDSKSILDRVGDKLMSACRFVSICKE